MTPKKSTATCLNRTNGEQVCERGEKTPCCTSYHDFEAFLRHFVFSTIINNFSTFFRGYVQPRIFQKKVDPQEKISLIHFERTVDEKCLKQQILLATKENKAHEKQVKKLAKAEKQAKRIARKKVHAAQGDLQILQNKNNVLKKTVAAKTKNSKKTTTKKQKTNELSETERKEIYQKQCALREKQKIAKQKKMAKKKPLFSSSEEEEEDIENIEKLVNEKK